VAVARFDVRLAVSDMLRSTPTTLSVIVAVWCPHPAGCISCYRPRFWLC